MKYWIFIGAILLAISVLMGAMGNHYFREVLEQTQGKEAFFRAQFYMIIHAFGLILAGFLGGSDQKKVSHLAPSLFLAGIILFSGTLFLNSLGLSRFGMAAPFGGLSFMVGWVLLGIYALKRP
jgi:uncharacterized membrane protein YgdD (TMEM256/DUF423 family)